MRRASLEAGVTSSHALVPHAIPCPRRLYRDAGEREPAGQASRVVETGRCMTAGRH